MRKTARTIFYFTLTLTAGALTQPVFAQETPDEDKTESNKVVITGSRLASGYTAPSPTSVIGEGAIEERAPAQISELLDRLPTVRLSSGPSQSQRFFNTGASPIDLRGFGAARTLTLVNGNRFTSGTVDSSLIPVNLIERVDVVTGGASAAYGSDAVAGVVNFVLKSKLDGLRATLQYGVSQEGDDKEHVFNFAYGSEFGEGRGHYILGYDHSKNDGVGPMSTRDWGKLDPFLVANGLNRPAGTPAQSFMPHVLYSKQSIGGLVISGPLAGTAFGPGGAPFQFQYGTVLSSLMIGGVNPQGNPNYNAPLLTPTSRDAALARVEYDFTPSLSAYLEGNYGYTKTDSTTNYYQAVSIVGIDNPFLPAATRQAMTAANVKTIEVGRLTADEGGFLNYSTHETKRVIGGLEGSIFGDFSWDVNVGYARTENLTQVDDEIVANYLAATDVTTDSTGKPICRDITQNPNLTDPTRRSQVQPGCVPFNIFGPGSPSAAAYDYITGHGGSINTSAQQMWDATANLRGSPFKTWAGPVNFAIGAEWRKEASKSHANPLALVGAWNASNIGEFTGDYTIKEGFVEVAVPLAKDIILARAVDVDLAYRSTNYSTSGTVQTWKIGGNWEPVDGLRLRATSSRDIRAPSLANLFSNVAPGGCCNITNPLNGQSGRLRTASTGNPNLTPEIADTITAGFVLQPAIVPWFKGSVDYYDIQLKDAITTVAGTEILNRCAAGQAQYCAAVVTDNSAFGIDYVRQQPFNLNQESRRGIDFSSDLTFSLPASIDLAIRLRASKVIDSQTNDRGTIIERAGSIQGGGVPEWSGTADFNVSYGDFVGTMSARYFSESKFDATQVGPEDPGYASTLTNSLSTNRVPSKTYFDLYGQYSLKAWGSQSTLFVQVQNLFNEDPWLYAATSIVNGGNPYDLIGRRFRVGVRVAM